jgi:hypothetical protein
MDLLDDEPANVMAVARAVALAADERLKSLSTDPTLAYCFWLLVLQPQLEA